MFMAIMLTFIGGIAVLLLSAVRRQQGFSGATRLPVLFDARPLYFREKNSSMYSAESYYVARFVVAQTFWFCKKIKKFLQIRR